MCLELFCLIRDFNYLFATLFARNIRTRHNEAGHEFIKIACYCVAHYV